MADEPDDAMVVCTPFPVKDRRKHLLMMYAMDSTVDRCAKCDGQIYVSSFGRSLVGDPAYKSVTYVCETCAAIDAPNEHFQALPGARAQLETVFGVAGTDELVTEVSGLTLQEFYRELRRRDGETT